MSWLAKLYETYNQVIDNHTLPDRPDPYFHIREGCHIEITLDDSGCFKSAQSLVTEKIYGNKTFYTKHDTVIPVTPKSLTGRTSGPAPYPLAEKIQYVAKDYREYGGTKASYFSNYLEELKKWASDAQCSHWKVKAILRYVEKGTVVKDLVNAGILFSFNKGGKQMLITKWQDQAEKGEKKPPLIQSLTGGEQGNAIIRWRVQKKGEPDDTTWNDDDLIKSWQLHSETVQENNGFCQILGNVAYITQTHPKAIYPQAINAKLISTPTDPGYLTYQGKFTDDSQPVGISFEASQKSHNTLRWLIHRGQGKTIGESKNKNRPAMIVSWAVSGADIPQPLEDTWDLLSEELNEVSVPSLEAENKIDHTIDHGQSFSIALGKYMAGYKAQLSNTGNIVIMGLDSATDGRMAVTYYQEFFPEEYIARISQWHNDFAWFQRHKIEKDVGNEKTESRTVWAVGAPSPRSIWEAVYGTTLNNSLKKSTVERILPCIVEARPFPRDLVDKAVHRACNRSTKRLPDQYSNRKSEIAAWERHLGIACALYRGYSKRNSKINKEYLMGLEQDNTSRDYLYGRLLAIAERLEYIALQVADEKRSTTAGRLMQRFADRPSSTWRNIELALQPYIQRLRSNRAGFLHNIQTLLDEVMNKFTEGDFVNDKPLSGEFLLAYHSQRLDLRNRTKTKEDDELENEGEQA